MPVQEGLRAGDVYTVKAIAAKAEGPARIVVLNGSAIDISGLLDANYAFEKVEFLTTFDGEIDPKRNTAPDLSWTAEDNFLQLESGLALKVDGRDPGSEYVNFNGGTGKVFVHYRAARPVSINDPILKYATPDEIVATAGKIDPENPLAFGLSTALGGSQGKPVFGGAVNADTADAYIDILRKASNRDDLYAIAAMTYDLNIVNAIKLHVNAMSEPDEQKWRRAYFSTKTPNSFVKIGQMIKTGDNFNATVVDDGTGSFTRVITDEADFEETDIQVGDLYRTNFSTGPFGEVIYDQFKIAVVVSNEELLLESGPSAEIVAPQKFEIWAADTGLNMATFVGAISKTIGDRRMANVWVDTPEILRTINGVNQFTLQEVFYVAAELVGLRSAMLVQMGLTRTELNSVSRAVPMFNKYTGAELDIAAANGTFIITQIVRTGIVYVRHQLTTEVTEGSLQYEDNVGVNADEISYATKDFVAPFIGKRNATPATASLLRIGYEDLLIERTKASVFEDIGAQIISVVDGTVKAEIDPKFKDTINLESLTELPLPLNSIFVRQTHRTILTVIEEEPV